MKRYIKTHPTIIFEFNIEILCDLAEIESSTDLTDSEYDKFITSMMSIFYSRDYTMSRDPDHTHPSNRTASLSEYFAFTKWIDDIQVIVVINVKVSDHPDNPKNGLSGDDKRAQFVGKLAKGIAKNYSSNNIISRPVDIIFDDKHLHSYSSAQFKLNSELNVVDREVEDIRRDFSEEIE